VYPAFAVAQAIALTPPTEASPRPPTEPLPVELIFVGGERELDTAMLARSGVDWKHTALIQGGPIHGVNPARLLLNVVRLGIGGVQAMGLMLRFRPERVLLTGGWAGLPVTLAAWLCGVPIVCFVPDIEPGWALKLAGRLARRVAATTTETAAYFPPGKVVATGYPLRQAVLTARRETALAYFDLDPARRTLLILGGSRGARHINQALLAVLPELLQNDAVQVIHSSGTLDWPSVRAAHEELPSNAGARYHAFAYLHGEMGLALAAADLVVSRAGGSTLGEFPQFGLPAILVPYPYAWRYQKVNADYLVSRGAAIRLDDVRLSEDLLPTIRRLLDDPVTLRQMAERSRALARPEGAQNIAHLLIELEAR
jgi:UDP-N-acetylglucosamine:LPS N-acetylglucosamine transferase